MSFMHDEWLQNKISEIEGKQTDTDATLIRIDSKMAVVEEYYRSTKADVARVEIQATSTRDRLDDYRSEVSTKLSGIIAKNIGASVLVGVTIALAAVVVIYMYIDTKYQNLDEKIKRIEKVVEDQGRTSNDKVAGIESVLKELQTKGEK
ncbi:MAG: hypothetical protein V3573_01640 [Desulfovibrionaceae bacterium]